MTCINKPTGIYSGLKSNNMKKIYILSLILLTSIAGYSQCSVIINNSQNVSCNGMCDGSATATTVGVPTFTFAWAPGGQTVQNPNNLCPGTHTVTMTDANSCQATATVLITEPAALATQVSSNAVSCYGDCDGDATASPSGGTQPYTFAWDTSANSQITGTASALCPGTYTVTVTDANGCTTVNTVFITEPTALTISTTSSPASCQACTDGSATATVNGGTPSYSYLWMPGGQTTATASNLGGGTYTVTATDAQGCSIMDTIAVVAPTGIVSNTTGMYLHVYPNPILNVANIEVGYLDSEVMSVMLFDVTGKMVDSKQFNVSNGTTVQMSFENYPSGAYLMEVRAGDSKTTVKVFKQ
jgi:hypothetical protein